MPIYEYQCASCGHHIEKLQKISDEPLCICPSCQAPELEKIISQAGFRLKGTGWYETDFKKTGQKHLASDPQSNDSVAAKPCEASPAATTTVTDTSTSSDASSNTTTTASGE